MAGGIKLAPLMTEIKVDINNFKSDMDKAASIGVSEAERIGKSMSTTAKVGKVLSKTGATLTKGLTVKGGKSTVENWGDFNKRPYR